ncbi:hypothetical protein FH610_004235 [Microbispora catharanthi]|uniref:Uncharacterized protein n=1 Tax=Microbispora catharanthi TaxID=1712871 RepID=A0A5N6C302_9ACTN|nr:hypothetical protein FH610_004235 [Microbispora catharanthi]
MSRPAPAPQPPAPQPPAPQPPAPQPRAPQPRAPEPWAPPTPPPAPPAPAPEAPALSAPVKAPVKASACEVADARFPAVAFECSRICSTRQFHLCVTRGSRLGSPKSSRTCSPP